MLLLIDTCRNILGVIQEDIRSHEVRICYEAFGKSLVKCGLGLELMHTGEVSVRSVALEDPGQVSVIQILGLDVDVHILEIGIYAAGDIHRDGVDDVPVQSLRILRYRDGMHVRDEEESLIVLLIVYYLADAACIVSDRKCAAGLKPCQ